MMKKILYFLFVLWAIIFLTGCSNHSKESKSSGSTAIEKQNISRDFSVSNTEGGKQNESKTDVSEREDDPVLLNETENINIERKIIYNAHLRIQVKDYDQTLDEITKNVHEFGGYVVESMMSKNPETNSPNGEITVRIPQEKFRDFISLVEKGSSKVVDSSITGQDVTEEYIDLESRLKSKQTVESRLISFMEQAEKTEDLLAISKDLAKVQEEIETIKGRMNYLENKADLATVTISIEENKVEVKNLGDSQLKTWEKTKEQFKKSINFLISAFSSLFIFLIGYLPILVLLGIIAFIIIFIIRKRKKREG
ncbi:DUF4349 domain-containing protein [Caldifermentibacillus hisashii]|uniref:DUF4349 domain-containing protein n=1 Tax=Caldifermentibacillus hisashii TaxID=996558 RepID=UPI0031010380